MNGRDWAEKHHERERERELEIERESRQSDTKQLRVVLNTKHGVSPGSVSSVPPMSHSHLASD